ncbi:MAG TPA: hypothetical protein VGH28_23420 [Polyangiaceae bacterium]|jgi:hypothetical protein
MRGKKTLWLFAIAALVGCGDILGLDGYTDQDGSLDAFVGDAPSGDAPSGDAKSDAAPSEGGSDAAACAPNLLCVTAPPSGWAWAVYDPDTRPACATGYATPTDVEEGLDAGAATCGCGCTTTQPTCTGGNLTIGSGNNACNASTQTESANTGNCAALNTSFSTSGASKVSITGPAPTGGSCTATPTTTLPAVGYAHQGRTCDYAGDAGACGAGSVCVPDPKPFGLCVSQSGTNACPAGFPTQHVVGTSVTDTRGCSSCGCTFDAGACTGTTTLYANTGCSMSATPEPTDGTCNGAGNHTWKGYAYAPTTNGSCAGSAVSADGGVVFADTKTVCCQ